MIFEEEEKSLSSLNKQTSNKSKASNTNNLGDDFGYEESSFSIDTSSIKK
jgi:hypothetical protein